MATPKLWQGSDSYLRRTAASEREPRKSPRAWHRPVFRVFRRRVSGTLSGERRAHEFDPELPAGLGESLSLLRRRRA